MGLVDLLVMLVFAAIAGFVAAQLMGQRRANLAMLIVFGFAGALLGRFLANFFKLPDVFVVAVAGSSFDVVWSFAGCLLVIAVVGMLGQRSY